MAVVALRKKESPINVSDILKGARKSESPSKSKVPVIEADKSTQELAAEVRKLKDEVDSSTALFEAKAAELIAAVTPSWEKVCKSGYQSSLKVPTPDGTLVGVTFDARFTKISPERGNDPENRG